MVRYQDGSVLAQLGEPDMRTPIAHHGMAESRESGVAAWIFLQPCVTFAAPDW